MLNRKEKAFNLGFLVVWIVLSLAPPVAWLSENLRSAGLLPVIGNYAVFALVFAYAWWGVTSFRYTRPRAFWSAAFAAGVPIYLYAGFIAWSGWLSLTRLALPFMVLIFFIVNPRWGSYLDSLSSIRVESPGEANHPARHHNRDLTD